MLWKLIIGFLQCRKKDYVRAVSTRGCIYIVDIHKYVPVEQEIQKWKNALEESRAPD